MAKTKELWNGRKEAEVFPFSWWILLDRELGSFHRENAPTRNGWTHLNPEGMTGHMANGGFLSFCVFHLHSEEFISVPVTCESDDGTRATEQDVNPASWETTKPYFALARICLQRSCVKEKWWTRRKYRLFSLVEPNGQRPKPGPSIDGSWIIFLSCRWTGLPKNPSLPAMNLEHTTLIVPKFCFQGILHTSSQRS